MIGDTENYLMNEFGRTKMTEVNKLRNILHYKLHKKNE